LRPAVEGVAKASYTYLDNLYVFHHVGGQNNKSGQSNESGGQNNASRTEISRIKVAGLDKSSQFTKTKLCEYAYFGVDNLTNQIKKGLCVQPSLITTSSWFCSKQSIIKSIYQNQTFESRSDTNNTIMRFLSVIGLRKRALIAPLTIGFCRVRSLWSRILAAVTDISVIILT
jgi:hypothetical protein